MHLHHFNPENPNKVRGIMPFRDNDPAYKEMYDKGMPVRLVSSRIARKYKFYEHTPYSDRREYRWINKAYDAHYLRMLQLGITVMRHISLSIGKTPDYFDTWFQKDSLSRLRSIFYKPRPQEYVNPDLSKHQMRFTTPEHTDSSMLTFLSTFGFPGL